MKKTRFYESFKNIIDDNLPSSDPTDQLGYRPVRFQPTNPTPSYPAHLCNIYLSQDNKMCIESGDEIFEDETIVEFRFEKNAEKFWQWVPIRVRNDKTQITKRITQLW